MAGPMITKKRMLQILSRSSGSDRASRIWDRFLSTMILLNLLAVSMESIDSLSAAYGTLFFAFKMISVTIFGVDYLLESGVWQRMRIATTTPRPGAGWNRSSASPA